MLNRPCAAVLRAGRHRTLVAVVAVTCAFGIGTPIRSDDSSRVQDRLWQLRNLGKAFYENPTTSAEAVEQFRQALELAPDSPRERLNYGLALLRAAHVDEGIAEIERVQRQDSSLPHTWFNLGIQYKKRGTPESNALAIQQFERMVSLAPDEPASHYNLGYLYKVAGRAADALKQFEIAARLEPTLAGPHFQLYNAYRDAAEPRPDDAARELAVFQAIKKRQAGAAIPEDLDWSYYSEIYDPIDADTPAETDRAPAPPAWHERAIAHGIDAATANLAVIDANRDGRPDLLVWSSKGVVVFAGGDTAVDDAALQGVSGIVSVAAGDFDNDGAADLAILTTTDVSLWRAAGDGRFVRPAAPLAAGSFTRAIWVDYDHDYDLDLLLLGVRSVLLRNSGDGTFADVTKEFPFAGGAPLDAALFEAIADSTRHDIVVSFADRPAVLYRDRLAGKYEAQPLDALPAGARSLVAADVNRDGSIDIAASTPSGPIVLLNTAGRMAAAQPASPPARSIVAADVTNDGVWDLVAGDRLLRWTPAGFRDAALGIADAVARVAADFDGDGSVDLASVDRAGVVHIAANAGRGGRWLRVTLVGVKNLKTGTGARIEIKAGAHYQKALYGGVPLLFGIGDREIVDTVRITWPNGLIQNEPNQSTGRDVVFKEAQRLSGSCPMIFTWDGSGFRFITDVLGVAPLGASAGDGEYFPTDHDEYVTVPGEALASEDGRFEVRITEELREVSYLDRVQLIAVDHHERIDIVSNEKFKSPPFPEFRLFGVDHPIAPLAARDERGADVRDRLLAVDHRYADAFRRGFDGVAEMHHLDLDFGDAAADGRAVLMLTGWVDWADGSTFRAASQATGGGLVLPYLQVKDGRGEWRTVVDDMGIPAGKPKTIAVDLTGKFLSASREIRIVTNLCVYWDRVFLSARTAAPVVHLTPIDPSAADLRFRGFSRVAIDPERKQPEMFVYGDVRPTSMWNPIPGRYTRYGDVRTLLTAADDRLLVMGSGDEVRLVFRSDRLPPLAAGWRRDFLLLVDGWAKDGDANTAFADSVEPLPFHAMSAYPYGADERFPERATARAFNTRPALRLIRPLTP